MEIYAYISIIIALVTAYVTARLGQKHYNKVLAGSFFVSSITAMVVSSIALGKEANLLFESYIPWLVIVVISALLFFLARIGTYILAGALFTGIIVAILIILFGMQPDATLWGISLIIGIAVTILLRKFLIPVTVGLLAGSLIITCLLTILSLVDPELALEQLMVSWSAYQIVSIVIMVFSVYFQFGLHEKVFGKAPTPETEN